MSLRLFLILIFFGVLLAWVAWTLVLLHFNPEESGPMSFGLFYLSFFLGLVGTFLLVGDWLKARLLKKQLLLARLRTSLRHAVFFSVFIIGWLFLKSLNIIEWWSLLLFMLVLLAFEFFFVSLQK